MSLHKQNLLYNPCVCVLVALTCLTLCNPTVCPWNSLRKNTGVGCHALLQGIFLTQGWNQSLLHCRWILYHLSHQGNPYVAVAAAKSLQSCPTLCDPIDGSPPGSPVPGILQARTLEWVAISFSNARKWKVKAKSLSCVWLLATPWTAAHQASPSMGFSRQEYWSGVPLPSPETPIPIINFPTYLPAHNSWLQEAQALFLFLFESRSVVSDSLWPPWTVAYQAPLSMEFSRPEYWSG